MNVDKSQKDVNGHDNKIILDKTSNGNSTSTKTPLQEFYQNECVFMTGGTGFLGKVLIEKLLRCCPDISRIYILIRSKKGKNILDRKHDLLSDPIFDTVREMNPEFEKKIFGIFGDCGHENLGLDRTDEMLLINEVSIVFHVAATVRFQEPLTLATSINVRSTSCVIDICKKMPKLKSFIYVSTAYANAFSRTIGEKFYDYSVNYEDFLKLQQFHDTMLENDINKAVSRFHKEWPNTYTFTKALSENLIKHTNKGLPMGIFRPGIVISTAEEPVVGWVDNYYGPNRAVAASICGFLRIMTFDNNKIANLVPVDLMVNALIASAWDVATRPDRRDDNMLIYNYTSTIDAPISWGMWNLNGMACAREHPPKNVMWYPSMIGTKYQLVYYIGVLFLHWIPAIVVDVIAAIIGKKLRLKKIYSQLHKLDTSLAYFTLNEWIFTADNVRNMWQRLDSRDQKMFNFSMQNFNWTAYMYGYIEGIKKYLFKDGVRTFEEDKAKARKLYWQHQCLIMLLVALGCWLLWKILQ